MPAVIETGCFLAVEAPRHGEDRSRDLGVVMEARPAMQLVSGVHVNHVKRKANEVSHTPICVSKEDRAYRRSAFHDPKHPTCVPGHLTGSPQILSD
jgi:hypothetical protein